MKKTKQVRESVAINTINRLLRAGYTITGTKYNGQPSPHRYVMITYIQPKELHL